LAVASSTAGGAAPAADAHQAAWGEAGPFTRRDVLKSAAVAGVAALAPLLPCAPGAHPLLPQLVITEPRFAESRPFLAGIGSAVPQVQAGLDVCRQWYDSLQQLASRHRGAVAGLTTWIDFLVLRGCFGEVGFRCRYHGEHAPRAGDGVLSHTVFGDGVLMAALIEAAHDWPRTLGTALVSGREPVAGAVMYTGAVAGVRPPGHMRLVSWLFAPR
jgi:hypothetical protein